MSVFSLKSGWYRFARWLPCLLASTRKISQASTLQLHKRLLDGSEFTLRFVLLAWILRRPHDEHWLCGLAVWLDCRSLLAASLAWAGSAVWPSRGEAGPPSLVLLLSGLGNKVGIVVLHVLVQLLEELSEPLLHEGVADLDLIFPRQRIDLVGHCLL